MREGLQLQQWIIDQEIIKELTKLAPENWHAVTLKVKRFIQKGGESFEVFIESPEMHKDSIQPSDFLFMKIRELSQLMKSYSANFKEGTYKANYDFDRNKWRVEEFFSYYDDEHNTVTGDLMRS